MKMMKAVGSLGTNSKSFGTVAFPSCRRASRPE